MTADTNGIKAGLTLDQIRLENLDGLNRGDSISFAMVSARIASSSFEVAGSLTVSLGYGAVGQTENRDAAFSEIDRALRQAKEGGRNRAVATARSAPEDRGPGAS